jgi:hypothetical protein
LSFIRTKTGGTVQIGHGPPITENSAKIPYKSMTVGTEHGEDSIQTYVASTLAFDMKNRSFGFD